MLAVDTAEPLRLEGTKRQYKLCGKLEGTAYFQRSADRLLRSRAATVRKNGLKGVTDL